MMPTYKNFIGADVLLLLLLLPASNIGSAAAAFIAVSSTFCKVKKSQVNYMYINEFEMCGNFELTFRGTTAGLEERS